MRVLDRIRTLFRKLEAWAEDGEPGSQASRSTLEGMFAERHAEIFEAGRADGYADGLRDGRDQEIGRLTEIVAASGIADNPHAKAAAIGLALDLREAPVDRIVSASRRLVSVIEGQSVESALVPHSARLADRFDTDQTDSLFSTVNAQLAAARERPASTLTEPVSGAAGS